MAFHVRNKETERLTRELARSAGLGLTEAVHLAVESEIGRRARATPLWQRSAALRGRIALRLKERAPVDKAFRDSLYE
ncbi:MAG TPA: type II toxin-antitoxin system VapB family antitoxin [Aestuariivirga sp.]|nr:type II toxin-antitoxin system VapB family antitoxin [Aestuariivirga sp.]